MIVKLFSRNFHLKLIALALAVLLELYFYSPENFVTLDVPASVRIINAPASQMIVDPVGASEHGLRTTLTVRGPSMLAQQFLRSQPTFYVSVGEDVKNSYSVNLNPEDLNLPLGLEILSIKPVRVDLRFEKLLRKELQILPVVVSRPAPGFRLGKITVIPKKLNAIGPQSELEGVMQIKTAQVDISGLSASKVLDVPLKEIGPISTYSVNMVSLEIEIEPSI